MGVVDLLKLSDRHIKSWMISMGGIFMPPQAAEVFTPPVALGTCIKHPRRKNVRTREDWRDLCKRGCGSLVVNGSEQKQHAGGTCMVGWGAARGAHGQHAMRLDFSHHPTPGCFFLTSQAIRPLHPFNDFTSKVILRSRSRSIATTTHTEMDHVPSCRLHKYSTGIFRTASVFSHPSFIPSLIHLLLFIALPSPATLSTSSMKTCQKNKSTHSGKADMTASQLALAGLSQNVRKKPTKDQRIAALEEQLEIARELISRVTCFSLHHAHHIALTPARFPVPLRSPHRTRQRVTRHRWRHRPRN